MRAFNDMPQPAVPGRAGLWLRHWPASAIAAAMLLPSVGLPAQTSAGSHDPAFGRPGMGPDVRAIHGPIRASVLNAERYKSIREDTSRLLQLANELNSEIESASETPPTPDQLRKVKQIEKLAHKVKTLTDRMSWPE